MSSSCATSPAAELAFGARRELAERYAERLAGTAVVRGLLGPGEAGRVWERHLLQGAALAELVPRGSEVLDVGSGAGLPGLPLALARPDVEIVLLDAALRRVTFLEETVTELGLTEQVGVRRGRLEELPAGVVFPVLTARAVAPFPTLLGWARPHLAPGGRLLAVVGSRDATALAGDPSVRLRRCGGDLLTEPIWVAEVSLG